MNSTKITNFSFEAGDKETILKFLETSETKGLTEREARDRIKQFGINQLSKKKKFQVLLDFLESFANPLILLLIFASLISAFLGEVRDFFLIIGIIFISGVVSFYQHFKAEHEAEKLKQKVILSATVLRDGVKKEIPFSHITIGDIVILSVGDILPADCRLLSEKDLTVDESTLTGESFPVNKISEEIKNEKLSLSEKRNIVFMGTHVLTGEGIGVVVAIGKMAEFGKLSQEITVKKPATSFDKSMNAFGFFLLKATLILTLFVFFSNAFLKHEIVGSFLFALALAVGLTPELLPVILTINLAKGAMKMSKKDVIVKFLPAIQNLGGMDVLCTDKTGTLTENTIELKNYENYRGEEDKQVLQYAIANSLYHSGFQNPIDMSLIGLRKQVNESIFEKIDDIPYDFKRKRLSVIVKNKTDKKQLMITKGAAHQMWPTISSYRDGKKERKITKEAIEKLQTRFEKLSSDGFRVVVVCTKDILEQKTYEPKDEHDLVFEGFLTFFDPPKKGVLETFNAIEELGITIKILTGDNELVTHKVCEETGVPIKGILLGDHIDSMGSAELLEKIDSVSIFARLNPEQKSKVIKTLQKKGHVVGYLGDGVNDAPPLKDADVGISVNNGSDITRDIADIILMKKSLLVLKDGILEGRKTYANILKYIMMETSSNFGNMITVAIASLFLPFLPMLPIQILLNNFLYDLSQLAIPTDNVDPEFTRTPRKWDISFINNFMVIFGPISSIFDFITFFTLLFVLHASAALFQTGWFVESLITQALIIFSIRTKVIPFWKSKPGKYLVISSVLVSLAAILITNSPAANYFSFIKLPVIFYSMLLAIILLYFLITEATKKWFYR